MISRCNGNSLKTGVSRLQLSALLNRSGVYTPAREMKGCYVYFTDPETAIHFRSRIAYHRQQPMPDSELRMVADKPKDPSP